MKQRTRRIMQAQRTRGVTVMLVLVFMGIFILLIGGLTGYVFTESKIGRASYAQESAFQIAEAGLEYYRWFLAHNPGNLTDGTGKSGPYVHNFDDPETGTKIGSFSLAVTGNFSCNVLQSADIASTGTADSDPQFKQTLDVRYADPSVAEYAYIINTNVDAGPDRVITGPYHANGGIRMDGTNNSTVSSSVASWTCTSITGCDPDTKEPGVFGEGSGSALWTYPVPQMDFAGLATDFPMLKSLAQAQGLYFPSTGESDQEGYHLIFHPDNTVDVYQVTGTSYQYGLSVEDTSEWRKDYDTITSEKWKGTYSIPPECPVIFVEAKAWIEGEVGGKVTLVAADTSTRYAPDIILENNITYSATDGSVGLTAIAEHSIRIPDKVPTNMSVRGIFVAQTGYFGRDLYPCTEPYDQLGTLSVTGTVVSNETVGTKWTYTTGSNGRSCGTNTWSGFNTRIDAYDKVLAQDPPPFTPVSSADAEFVVWRED